MATSALIGDGLLLGRWPGRPLAGTAWVLLPPAMAVVAIAIAAMAGITCERRMARRHGDSGPTHEIGPPGHQRDLLDSDRPKRGGRRTPRAEGSFGEQLPAVANQRGPSAEVDCQARHD